MSDENHDGSSSSSSPSPSLKKSENEEESQFEEASTDGFSLDNDNDDNDHDNDHDNADNNLFPDDPIDLKVVTPPTNTVVVVDWKDGFQSLHLRDSDHRTLEEEEVGEVVHNHNSSHTQVDSFHHHDVPFYGRQDELQTLQKALKRISLEWMENPPEVCWITGECGVGKTALIRQLILVEKKSTSISTSSLLFCQGTCEQHHCATQPFRALTDCLNDLCSQLLLFPRNNNNNNGNGNVWKSRLEDALGGEGPLLGTIVPQLAKLLNVAPMSPKFLMPFDANTPKRLDRLAFAVRDLLQAVSEYHPVVMIVDNIHWADSDSLKMMEELLSTTKPPLPNFLLIGLHEPLPLLQHEVVVVPEEQEEDQQQQQHSHDDDDALELLKQRIGQQTETRVTTMDLERMDLQSVEEILCGVFLEEHDLEDDAAIDKVQDLGEILFALTKGNTLWMMSLLRLLYDIKLVYFTTKTDDDHKWDWNRKKIKKTLKGWRESNDKAFGSCQGVLATRLDKLPKKVKFVVTAMSSLGLSTFCVAKLYPCLQVAFRTGKEGKECPITSQEDLELFCFKACEQGIFKRLAKPGYYKFVHGIVRDAAYTLLKKPSVVHFKLGTELQALSIAHQGEERERFKFLAVYQLNQCVKTQEDPNVKAKVAKLNLEAAELAIQKTAFRTSIEYLETGINALDPEIQWKPPFYEATLRTFLVLARMRLCCGRLDQARDACEDIFLNATSLKDRVHASQVIGMLLLEQKQYSTALEKIAHILAEMGEVFPKEDLGKIVDREIHGLRKMVRQKDNKQLLNPPRMSDKKMIDAMVRSLGFLKLG